MKILLKNKTERKKILTSIASLLLYFLVIQMRNGHFHQQNIAIVYLHIFSDSTVDKIKFLEYLIPRVSSKG